MKKICPFSIQSSRSRRVALFLCSWVFFACGQNPIFFEISNEVEPKDPRIVGGPTKPVVFKDRLYVASGAIHRYNGSSRWEHTRGQPGNTKGLAVTGNFLYALTISGAGLGSAELWKSADGGATWGNGSAAGTPIANETGYPYLQTIFGVRNILFVGARKSQNENAVLYMREGDDKLSLLREFPWDATGRTGGELRGADFLNGEYYIATTNRGIYANSDIETLKTVGYLGFSVDTENNNNFNGLITVGNNTIIAVTSNGKIWYRNSGGGSSITDSYANTSFTGALALWKAPGAAVNSLLLLGTEIGGGAYSYGYREILLSGGELGIADMSLKNPGETQPSSVNNYPRYNSTIGKHSINGIIQVPPAVDPAMILFASTQKSGFWSYRNEEWNAEE
ncbi:MAG: hypothetical protein LBP43_06270 [Treponema sp.]|jgi:hypothetical protein|nr:hypothetical protein [Treponema sp.]